MSKKPYIRLAKIMLLIIESHQSRPGSIQPMGYWKTGRLIALANLFCEKDLDFLLNRMSAALFQLEQAQWTTQKLKKCLQFYYKWPQTSDLKPGLSWSHFQILSGIQHSEARTFYLEKSAREHWSCQTLKRQIKSRYFERSLHPQQNPKEYLKDHYILDYTALPANFNEQELEDQLLLQLEYTLLEMGSGFTFVARQKRIATFTGKQFFIDLVFYHTPMKMYLLVELKKGELCHRDLGQMDTYLRLFDQLISPAAECPSIGLVLCTFIDPSLQAYSLLNDRNRIFAATYSLSPASITQ